MRMSLSVDAVRTIGFIVTRSFCVARVMVPPLLACAHAPRAGCTDMPHKQIRPTIIERFM